MSQPKNTQFDALRQRLLDAPKALPAIDSGEAALARTASISRAKAIIPKRRRQTAKEEANSGTIFAAVLGDSIDVEKIEQAWHGKREGSDANDSKIESLLRIVGCVVSMEKQVSYMTVFEDLECFIFSFGSIVCWGMNDSQVGQLIAALGPMIEEPLVKIKKDAMVYTTLAMKDLTTDIVRPRIKGDNIQLETTNIFEKLAYSYALGQSVKLDAFEDEVAETINDTQDIPVHLASDGSIGMSNKAVTVKMGELFVQRCNVNLHSDILGTPDVFW